MPYTLNFYSTMSFIAQKNWKEKNNFKLKW